MEERHVQRRLAAILAAEVVGYSGLIGADHESSGSRSKTRRSELIDPAISAHRGRIVKTTDDGVLIEFASVVDAGRRAVAVRKGRGVSNRDLLADTCIELRLVIDLGDAVIEGDDLGRSRSKS